MFGKLELLSMREMHQYAVVMLVCMVHTCNGRWFAISKFLNNYKSASLRVLQENVRVL